jgi:hypothetical protein
MPLSFTDDVFILGIAYAFAHQHDKERAAVAEAEYQAGLDYLKRGMLDAAEVSFRNVLRVDPGAPGVHLQLAHCFEQQHYTGGALREYYDAAYWYKKRRPTGWQSQFDWLNRRIVALGGTPTVVSRPGSGSWIPWAIFGGVTLLIGTVCVMSAQPTSTSTVSTYTPSTTYAAPLRVVRDGRTLASQPQDVQDQFREVWGSQAEAEWVKEHNAKPTPTTPMTPMTPPPSNPIALSETDWRSVTSTVVLRSTQSLNQGTDVMNHLQNKLITGDQAAAQLKQIADDLDADVVRYRRYPPPPQDASTATACQHDLEQVAAATRIIADAVQPPVAAMTFGWANKVAHVSAVVTTAMGTAWLT